jgi:hypothetical protein
LPFFWPAGLISSRHDGCTRRIPGREVRSAFFHRSRGSRALALLDLLDLIVLAFGDGGHGIMAPLAEQLFRWKISAINFFKGCWLRSLFHFFPELSQATSDRISSEPAHRSRWFLRIDRRTDAPRAAGRRSIARAWSGFADQTWTRIAGITASREGLRLCQTTPRSLEFAQRR